jgi:hypothetical protein
MMTLTHHKKSVRDVKVREGRGHRDRLADSCWEGRTFTL